MKITREKGMESGYDYEFIQGNKKLRIIFGGNLDLYWSLYIDREYLNYEDSIKELYDTFIITKENYQIYSLFKDLLDNIRNSRIYTPFCETVLNEDEEPEELPPTYEELKRTEKLNEDLKNRGAYQYITDGTSVTWHSDEESYDIADIVKISEQNDAILLEFLRPELTGEKIGMRRPNTVNIRFRNSGSFYRPFNIAFMGMYNKLQQFDPELDNEYHQIHLEEMIYELKRGKK